jgi:DDE superfamily endonuclease
MIILFLHFHNSPANPQELFNLRHASARNIVERIFGILKNRFAILRGNPNLDVDTQAQIAPALAAIHNFIREYDDEEIEDLLQQYDADRAAEPSNHEATGDLAQGPARTAERQAADARRDQIANNMWQQYREELRRRDMA